MIYEPEQTISCRQHRRIFSWTIRWRLPWRFCAWHQWWFCIFCGGWLCFRDAWGRRRSPCRKYQWRGHTWDPNRCAPEYRNRSNLTKKGYTSVGEVFLFEFSVLDLESSFKDLFSLFTSNSDVYCHFFVSLDTEWTDGVFGTGRDGLLSWEILEHFGAWVIGEVPLVSLSPDSPTLMLRTSFSILISLMGFSFSGCF